jgi:hypothetical protein
MTEGGQEVMGPPAKQKRKHRRLGHLPPYEPYVRRRWHDGERITLSILCGCGAEQLQYEHVFRGCGKRCEECGGKITNRGAYIPPQVAPVQQEQNA